MNKYSRTLILFLAFSLVIPAMAQETKPQGQMSLSLDECIARALKRNTGLAVNILAPEISGEALNQAREKYLPTITLSARTSDQDSASYSWLDSTSSESVKTKSTNLSFGVSQAIPYGGTLDLSLTEYKTDTTQSAQTINPRYGSTLTLGLTQPLLKNFGYKISQREILIARDNVHISDQQLKQSLMDLIYNVESAYWSLSYCVENLDVKRSALQLAKDLLEKNQRSVEIGTLAPIDIVSAQAEVASREADIIEAEAQVKNAEDQLKQILNITGDEEKGVTAIVPKDRPSVEEKKVTFEEAMAAALQNRPDLEISRIGIKTDEFNVFYEKNQALPELNLSASYWSPGVSGTQIFYVGDPLNGVIDHTVPGGVSGAMGDVFGLKYKNWSVGVTMTIPTANIFSRASLAQARLNLKQAMLTFENDKEQISLEIKTAVRAVQTNYKRIIAYKAARVLAEQKLAAEEEKLKVGQSINYTVLSYQRDLADARISELNAIITYNISLATLEKALGLTLKDRNIRMVDYSRLD